MYLNHAFANQENIYNFLGISNDSGIGSGARSKLPWTQLSTG